MSFLILTKKQLSLKLELALALIISLCLLLLSAIVISRFSAVWVDEIMFTDPGVNLYMGQGFSSTAWWSQSSDEFWSGNYPLYSFLLGQWLHISGFSLVSVRALNYILIGASAIILWLSVLRLHLVTSTWTRLIFVTLVLSGYGIGFSYRTGRYDALTIFLCSLVLLAYSIPSQRIRLLVIVGITFLFPLAGLQLVLYSVIVCTLLFLVLGFPSLRISISIALGIFLGVIFLYGLYTSHGTLDIVFGMSKALRNPNIDGRFLKDPSTYLLLIGAVIIALKQVTIRRFKLRSPLAFTLLLSLVVPIVFRALGRFPTYYAWMVYIPLAIGLCSAIDSGTIKLHSRQIISSLLIGIITLSCLLGTPVQTLSGLYFWNERDYQRVEELVIRNTEMEDWVYGDFATYYALKSRAKFSAFGSYFRSMTSEEKDKIAILIINPSNLDRIVKELGGQWYGPIDEVRTQKSFLFFRKGFGGLLSDVYNLAVFKKKQI